MRRVDIVHHGGQVIFVGRLVDGKYGDLCPKHHESQSVQTVAR